MLVSYEDPEWELGEDTNKFLNSMGPSPKPAHVKLQQTVLDKTLGILLHTAIKFSHNKPKSEIQYYKVEAPVWMLIIEWRLAKGNKCLKNEEEYILLVKMRS